MSIYIHYTSQLKQSIQMHTNRDVPDLEKLLLALLALCFGRGFLHFNTRFIFFSEFTFEISLQVTNLFYRNEAR